MQFSTARRTGKTYGKTNRNLVVHDLFDSRESPDNASSTKLSRSSQKPTREIHPQPGIQDFGSEDARVSESTLPSASHVEQLAQTRIVRLAQSNAPDSSMFDITSSDEDAAENSSGSRASKRRRITKSSPVSVSRNDIHKELAPTQLEVRQAKLKNLVTKPDIPIIAAKTKPRPSKSRKTVPQTNKPDDQKRSTKIKMSRSKQVPRTTKTASSEPEAQQVQDIQMMDLHPTDDSEELSDQPRRTVNTTRKAARITSPIKTDSDVSSPGQLGLTGLQIGAPKLSLTHQSSEADSDGSYARKRSRLRLIDRLDAPPRSEEHTSEDQSLDAENSSKSFKASSLGQPRGRSTHGQSRKKQALKSSTQSEVLDDQQNIAARANKPRTTYATQRSYLSDMVNDLDVLNEPSSQKSVDELLLQPSVSNLASQLELEEDESDDPTGSSRLKSIHELRQAGANNRFDREIDALLEDIDSSDHSSKAVRLQALMKLVTKLEDQAFLRHMAGSGRVQRLTSFVPHPMDLLTSVLFVRTLSLLSRSEDILVATLSYIFKAASDLAPSMLVDSRPLAKVAKDRKQNLSKATIYDLTEFETSAVILQDPSTKPVRLCPDIVVLDCLERTLHKMIQLGNTSARVSTSVFSQVLRLLLSEAQRPMGKENDPGTLFKLQTTLSLLELCSVVVDDTDLRIRDDEYGDLGNVLAALVSESDKLPGSLQRNVLRAVVSLSNNKPRMCQLFGGTAIIGAAFDIVDSNFINLAKQAEDEQILDQDRLDAVVLALGCLLNFAECDPTLRIRLSKMDPGPGNYVMQLVSIFNLQVSKVDEAMTKEQSQVSVAFGYLSMLLCALSLDASIRTQVTQLLRDKSFEELCTAAEKFFSHLRTLENISEDDASMSSFTARFNAILETIRASKT